MSSANADPRYSCDKNGQKIDGKLGLVEKCMEKKSDVIFMCLVWCGWRQRNRLK